MSNQEIVIEQRSNVPAVSNESNALLVMIERLVLNPDADIDKLSKMLDLQERVLNRNAEQAFASDYAAMQSELPRIARNGLIQIKDKATGRITQSTPFAKLEDINDGVRPVLQKYGFGVSFSIEQNQSGINVTAKLLHRLGHSEKTSLTLPLDTSGSKNNVQSSGSTISYGKRYTMCAILNISTGDDVDGNEPPQEPQESIYIAEDDVLDIAKKLHDKNISKQDFLKAAGLPEIKLIQKPRLKIALKWIENQGVANASV